MINLLNKLALDNKKIFAIALVCLIIIYIDFTFLTKLQLRTIGNSRTKIIKLKEDMGALIRDLKIMQQSQIKQVAPLKSKKIISDEEIPSLLQDISDIANKHNVKIKQIKPSRDTKAKDEAVQGAILSPTIITLDLSCGYHSLGSFLNDLENAVRFIAVQGMKVTSSSSDYLNQSVNLVLKTYVKK